MDQKNKKKITILLVDDHPVVREGIRSCLSAHSFISILGEAANGKEAIRKTRELSPDLVLLDINMPHMNGLEVTRRLQKEIPKTKVLVLTVHNNREYVLQIVRAGARGYILKDASPDELVRAIESVHGGGVFLSPDIARFIMNDHADKIGESRELSGREREVLLLIAEGHSNKEIAGKLEISVRTVETHREHLMRKLDVRGVAGLTQYAIARGMVQAK